ncbi:MAG: glycosyltransferase family 39 protein [Candidatus Spechtbacterales bacterium]
MTIKKQKGLKRYLSATNVAAFLLLTLMAGLMLFQAANNTTIVDESAHIVSGYTYWTERDYRLNPEHPPLIKMIAGAGLLFQGMEAPTDRTSWTEEVNGQWTAGDEFLHWETNDPELVMFRSRIGPIIITLLLGVLIFVWTKKLYGDIAGLMALFLFALSPSFLGHGHLVTTDVGATFGFVLSIYYFLKYLENQTARNLIFAGVTFGIAQLIKFSLILLVPYFIILIILWIFFRDEKEHRPQPPLELWRSTDIEAESNNALSLGKRPGNIKRVFAHFGKLTLIFVIGAIIIFPAYQYSVTDYPPERQLSDTLYMLGNPPDSILGKASAWMADKPILRSYGHFFFGHQLVFERVTGGNVVYYFGNVSGEAWISYFPAVFLIKVPVALLSLIVISIAAVLKRSVKILLDNINTKAQKTSFLLKKWIGRYFIEIAMLVFITLYWTASILSNLNIGIRHVLPTFPFIYILVAGIVTKWATTGSPEHPVVAGRVKNYILRPKGIIITLLLMWYATSSLWVFPHSLSYFNELAGGPANGYRYVVDSNLDWGQDLGRLVNFVEENNIDEIKLDYFGGGNPEYYLGDRYIEFNPLTEQSREGWIAVSATHLQPGRAEATRGYEGSTTHYRWLDEYEPVEVIGYSIFVYFIE